MLAYMVIGPPLHALDGAWCCCCCWASPLPVSRRTLPRSIIFSTQPLPRVSLGHSPRALACRVSGQQVSLLTSMPVTIPCSASSFCSPRSHLVSSSSFAASLLAYRSLLLSSCFSFQQPALL